MVQNQWYHFGVGEFTTHFRTYFSGWIGMFTGGTIWVLTHGHMNFFRQVIARAPGLRRAPGALRGDFFAFTDGELPCCARRSSFLFVRLETAGICLDESHTPFTRSIYFSTGLRYAAAPNCSLPFPIYNPSDKRLFKAIRVFCE